MERQGNFREMWPINGSGSGPRKKRRGSGENKARHTSQAKPRVVGHRASHIRKFHLHCRIPTSHCPKVTEKEMGVKLSGAN